MSRKIFVIGSCNTDMVVKSEHIPAHGETILGGKFLMNAGGKGANQSVAAARMGGDVTFVARVGNDTFGQQAMALYEREGINTAYITVDDKAPSGVALILVDAKGENCISVAASANDNLLPEHVEAIKNDIHADDIVLMQLETPLPTVEYAARMAASIGAKVVLNPAPARILPTSLLKDLYMIVPNETEAEMLSGVNISDEASAREAAKIIADKGVDIVLVTMGAKGVLVKVGDVCSMIPANKVTAVDTTAAGDTFCGALCVALADGKNLFEAVKFANCAASVSVTRMGAQTSVPFREELERLM